MTELLAALPPQETELKLDLAPSALSQFARSVARQGHAKPRSKNIVSVYFDTDDHTLRKAGFTLRVRRDGKRVLQTVKQEGPRAALLARNEWEKQIRGMAPDFDAARETGLKPLLSKKVRRELKPMFETTVRRTIFPIRDSSAEIELVLDEGEVIAGDKSAALHEIEMELQSGAAADLFRLARVLGRDVPMQLSLRTKADRGYALLDGKPPVPVKALPVEIAPDASAGEALQAVARTCLHQLLANQPLIRVGRPEALHQMRVALRRLRAALSLFSAMLVDTQSREMKAQLRWLSRELNSARELDVFISRVEKLIESQSNKTGLETLLTDLRQRRAQAYTAMRAVLHSFRFRDLMLAAASWIEAGDWIENRDKMVASLRARPIADAAAEEMQRRYRKIRKRGKHLRELTQRRQHKLRIQAKKVRYAAEFFSSVYDRKKIKKRRVAFIKRLENFQNALGELNDITVHEEMSADLARESVGNGGTRERRPKKAFAAGRLSGFEEARMASLLKEADRAYRGFAKVKAFWR